MPPAAISRTQLPAELEVALTAALQVGARAPVILRVTEITGYTDWVLIVSGRIDRQVRSVCDAIEGALAATGRKPIGSDGVNEGLWSVLDYDDFIVHAFYHPVRTYYDLEGMWSDAASVALGLPDEIMRTEDLGDLRSPEVMPSYRGGPSFGGFEDEFSDEDEDLEGEDEEGPVADEEEGDEDDEDDAGEYGDEDELGDDELGDEELGDDDEAEDLEGDDAGDDAGEAGPPGADASDDELFERDEEDKAPLPGGRPRRG